MHPIAIMIARLRSNIFLYALATYFPILASNLCWYLESSCPDGNGKSSGTDLSRNLQSGSLSQQSSYQRVKRYGNDA